MAEGITERFYHFDDSILCGILAALGFQVNPIVRHGRVVFSVTDIKGRDPLKAIQGNEWVGASEVLNNIKMVRTMLYSAKDSNGLR